MDTIFTENLEKNWQEILSTEFRQEYFQSLSTFIKKEIHQGKIIYPPLTNVFEALNLTRFHDTKVIILGQDPYHGPGQAHGLCFSVPKDKDIPPSLKNIFQELGNDLKLTFPSHGNLQSWARQGVLLLNSILTVEKGLPSSHKNKGWEQLTDAIIARLNKERQHLVFLLWGNYALQKGKYIDRNKHLVLTTTHPSPLSAHRGFLGCRHFSKTNSYLKSHNLKTIDWYIT